jgi:hypothetical protein
VGDEEEGWEREVGMEEQGTLVRVAVLLAVRLRVVLEEQARLGEVEVEVVRVPVVK